MTKASVVFTAVPKSFTSNGSGSRAVISVYASIRLLRPELVPGLLGSDDYVYFQDWPQTLRSLQFQVTFGGNAYQGEHQVKLLQPPSSDLWKKLFPANLVVEERKNRKLSEQPLASYDAAEHAELVDTAYGKAAATQPGDGELAPATLRKHLEPLEPNAVQERLQALRSKKYFEPRSTPDPLAASSEFKLFHGLPDSQGAKAPPTAEFHRRLGHLSEYPLLLRRLGIIFDLELTGPAAPPAPRGFVSVATPTQAGYGPVLPPLRTAYEISSRSGGRWRFLPASRAEEPEILSGMLRIRDSCNVLLVDPDAAGHQVLNMLVRLKSADKNEPIAPSALRGGGLHIMRKGTAQMLNRRWAREEERAAALGSGGWAATVADDANALYAEDLLRGYRIDLRATPKGGTAQPWRSLLRRIADHALRSGSSSSDIVKQEEDEGAVGLSITHLDSETAVVLSDGAPPQPAGVPFRVSEALARFAGWSLAVPHPAKGAPNAGDKPAGKSDHPVTTRLRVPPASLPKLRHGWAYECRARACFLTGEGLSSQEADEITDPSVVLAPTTFLRVEQIAPPLIVSGNRRELSLFPPLPSSADPAVPASAPTLPVGDDRGRRVQRMVIRSEFDEASQSFRASTVAQYHLLAPRISPQLKEWQGALDHHEDPKEMYQFIAEHDQPWPETSSAEKSLRMFHEDLPYLWDEHVAGARIGFLPGKEAWHAPPFSFLTTFKPALFPENEEARYLGRGLLQLKAGVGDPRVLKGIPLDPTANATDENVLEVLLPPEGGVVRTYASCYPRSASILHTFHLIDRGARSLQDQPDAASALVGSAQASAATGAHEMISASAAVELIHALQKPFLQPSFEHVVGPTIAPDPASLPLVDKDQEGSTSWRFQWTQKVHAPSTSSISVESSWNELQGDGTPLGRAAHATQANVDHPDGGDFTTNGQPPPADPKDEVTVSFSQTFEDGRYRRILYVAEATARFPQYFPEVVGKRARITRRSNPIEVDVPNSVRPIPPVVLRTMPSYALEGRTLDSPIDGFVRLRRQTGCTVMLGGPWYVSGEGELLGVVLLEGMPRAEELQEHVSAWGADPLFLDPANPLPPLSAEQFVAAGHPRVSFKLGAILDNERTDAISIVPHDVEMTEEGPVAHVSIDPRNAYFPMVRLAVCRFQPRSVSQRVAVSTPAICDVVPILPERRLEVQWMLDRVVSVSLTGTGTSARRARIRISVERNTGVVWSRVSSVDAEPAFAAGRSTWSVPGVELASGLGPIDPARLRLVIEEIESLPVDATRVKTVGPPLPAERVVFAEILPLRHWK